MSAALPTDLRGAGLLVLAEHPVLAHELLAPLDGLALEVPALSADASASDRRALPELERALEALAARPGVERGRLAVLGFGRGGTLAFLLACARELALVIVVDGPLRHAELSPDRPIQPLELALNLSGAFLGLFARGGPAVEAELEALGRVLTSAARPFELARHDDGPGFCDPHRAGYDVRRARERLAPVRAALRAHLSLEP
jgi:dienelactone hydrolase